MAFSAVTERGSNSDKVLGTTVAVSPSAAIAVDKIAFAVGVTDNTTIIQGASTDHASVTDTDGHTWTKVFERTATVGVIDDGVTLSLWWTKVTAEIGTGDSVTLTIGTARTVRTIGLFEVTVDAGQTVGLATNGSAFLEANATGNPAGLTVSSLASKEYLLLGLCGNEGILAVWTEDADYTNVYAAEAFGSTGGAGGTNISANVGARIATLTTDTFDVGGLATTDHALALLAFEEVAEGAATQNLIGTLFTKAPTFSTGVLTQGAPPAPPAPSGSDSNRMGGTGAIRKPPRTR